MSGGKDEVLSAMKGAGHATMFVFTSNKLHLQGGAAPDPGFPLLSTKTKAAVRLVVLCEAAEPSGWWGQDGQCAAGGLVPHAGHHWAVLGERGGCCSGWGCRDSTFPSWDLWEIRGMRCHRSLKSLNLEDNFGVAEKQLFQLLEWLS